MDILVLVTIIILGPIAYFITTHPSSAQAAWMDTNWSYRKGITVTNSTGSIVVNIQKAFSIDTQTLITNGKLQSNCNDLRFTDVSGKKLPYYIDSGCNTTTTKVWVLINTLPTSTSTIYMYYGNPTAVQGSSAKLFDNVVGIQGYWTFNDGSGTSVSDSTANANTGTWQGTLGSQWTTGQYSNAGNFNGSDNYVSVGSSGTNNNSYTYEAWVNPSSLPGNATDTGIIDFGDISGDQALVLDNNYNGLTGFGMISYYGSHAGVDITSVTSLPSTNQWYHVVGVRDTASNKLLIYVNGVLKNSSTLSNTTAYYGTLVYSYVGVRANSGRFAGKLDDVRVYNYARTAAQIANDYSAFYPIMTAGPSLSSSFLSEEQGPGPVAYWKFDEGTGTTAHDSTKGGNDGTITTATWQAGDQCISGKCLSFNGSTDFVTVPRNSVLNNTFDGSYSVSFWAKTSDTTSVKRIWGIADATSGFHTVLFNYPSAGSLLFYDGSPADADALQSTTAGLNDGKWHYYVFELSGTTQKIYIDGRLDASKTKVAATGSDDNFYFGKTASGNSSAQFYKGVIDEPKIYNYARSVSQIQADYNSRGGVLGASAVFGKDPNQNLSNGLVGYWKMDETSWSGAAGEVKDSSGNANNGTEANASITSGLFGNGGSYNGINSTVDVSDSTTTNFSTGSFSISMWVKLASLPGAYEGIIAKRTNVNYTGWDISVNPSNKFNAEFSSANAGPFYDVTSDSAATATTWTHIVVVDNRNTKKLYMYINGVQQAAVTDISSLGSTNNATNLKIGSEAGINSFNGTIDETRIYNRALSPAEVSQLYNFAPGAVGQWNFEEGQGSTVNDTSGNSNTGTWNGTGKTHWTQGKVGRAGNFNGNDDYVNVSNNSVLNMSGGNLTLEAWIKPTNVGNTNAIVSKGNGSSSDEEYLFETSVGGGGGLSLYYKGAWRNSSVNTLVSNVWQHVVAVVSGGSTLTFYVNGQQMGSQITGISGTYGPTLTNAFRIGTQGDACNCNKMSGGIDQVQVYNYARTQKQIVQDMNANHPAGNSRSMVGYWKFDEGYGTTAHDSSGNSLDSTLTNMASPATANSGWTNSGKFGKGINFDGSDDYISVSNNAALNFTGPFTISTWIKPSAIGSQGWLVGKSTSNATAGVYALYFTSGGKVGLQLYNGSFITTTTNTTLSTGKWYHAVGVFDGAQIKIYLNEVQDGTPTAASTYNTNSANLGIGGLSDAQRFSGEIDEVKIYNYALTSDEIKIDYNRGAAQKLGSIGTDSSGNPSDSADRAYCPPGDTTGTCGPIGEWNFEEGQGSTVNDSSGNGNPLSWSGTGKKHWAQGKFGKGGNYNGSDDYTEKTYTSLFTPGSNAWTVSAWVKAQSGNTTRMIVSWYRCGANPSCGSPDSALYKLYINTSNQAVWQVRDDASNISTLTSANTYADNTWHYLVGTYNPTNHTKYLYVDGIQQASDTSTSITSLTDGGISIPLDVGKDLVGGAGGNTNFFKGQIDQVRIYNYARSQAQVAWDYNRGAPVGWWKMDECQGTTAYDSSGNGNSGTITIGGTGTQTSVGTCSDGLSTSAWYNGRVGKINSSLNFDGTDDVVSIPNTSTLGLTSIGAISIWLKYTSAPSGWACPLWKNDSGTNATTNYGFCNSNIGNSDITAVLGNGTIYQVTTAIPIDLNNWMHIVLTWDGTNIKVYKNGVLKTTNSQTITPAVNTKAIGIGDTAGGVTFKGQIDDIRIYNYPLTIQQVRDVYNQGAVHFGPVVGSP